MEFYDLEPIEGMMSPKECCEAIQKIGNNIVKDQTSTLINDGRALTLKRLANLFLIYNNKMMEYNDVNRRGIK